MTVTAEVHKPAEKTPVPRKQPTPTQHLPFGKMPQKDSSGSSSSSGFTSVVSTCTKEIISRNVAQLIAQNVIKGDDDVKVVVEKHGEMIRGAVGAVKALVQKKAGRIH